MLAYTIISRNWTTAKESGGGEREKDLPSKKGQPPFKVSLIPRANEIRVLTILPLKDLHYLHQSMIPSWRKVKTQWWQPYSKPCWGIRWAL